MWGQGREGRKERRKGGWNVSKGYRSQPERVSNSQNWNALNCTIMTVLGHNSKNKINIHEYTPIFK